ncbi:cytochrome c oxidase subunit 1 [Streptomyces rapamycinicus]|nr:cytochrome c oxidase subunit 1 [Streptomyces rapamycinicus]
MGFLVTFLFGGLTGVLLASPPLDFHVTDSYFVVAHFHYVVFGTVVFAMFAGFDFWWPKMTGKMLDEQLGKITFWTLFVGFHGTFLLQHWLGAEGMPRRCADYLAADGFTALNTISTISSFLLGLSMLPTCQRARAQPCRARPRDPDRARMGVRPWEREGEPEAVMSDFYGCPREGTKEMPDGEDCH